MNVYEKIKFILGKGVVYLMFMIFPLVMHDKLNDVTITRAAFFLIVSYVSFLIMIINEIIRVVIYIIKEKYSAKRLFDYLKQMDLKEIIIKSDAWVKVIIIFLISSLLTYMVSLYKSVSLWGVGGRYTGFMFMLACTCIYIVISECYEFERKDLVLIMCSTLIVNIWAILNYAGLDPFYIYNEVSDNDKFVYISTLGNIDVYGMYVCMMLSVSMYAFIVSDDIKYKIFYGIVSVSGMMGVMVCDSDMAVAGMLFIFAILIYPAIYDISKFKRYCMLAAMLFIAGRISGLIYIINPEHTRVIKSVGSIMIYKNRFIIFFIVCCLIYSASDFIQRKWNFFDNKELLSKLRFAYVFISVGVAAVLIIICVVNTISQSGPLYLTDEWGSGRGYIWKNSMDGYMNLPLVNKILGAGQAATAYVLNDYSTVHTNIFNRTRVDNVHNIWLNILVNMGIVGLLSYISIIALGIYNTLRYIKRDEKYRLRHGKSKSGYLVAGFGVAVIVYSVQGSAELLETLTFPMFFSVCAILNCGKKGKNNKRNIESINN